MIKKNYQFGVITDEIDLDFKRACRIAAEEGMSYVELHKLWQKDIHELSDAELVRAKAIVDEYGLKTHLICGMFFRPFSLSDVDLSTMHTHPRFKEHLERLERFMQIAHTFDAPYIRTFGFTRDTGGVNPSPRLSDGGGMSDEIVEMIARGLKIACQRLQSAGLTLALENARSLYANTGGNMGRVLDATQMSNLKIIWDPANAFVAGEDPLQGYHQVKGHIVDVHCKDAQVVDAATGLTAWERIGDGGTDWRSQLKLLLHEAVDHYTIETHWQKPGQDKAENTRQTFAGLKNIIQTL